MKTKNLLFLGALLLLGCLTSCRKEAADKVSEGDEWTVELVSLNGTKAGTGEVEANSDFILTAKLFRNGVEQSCGKWTWSTASTKAKAVSNSTSKTPTFRAVTPGDVKITAHPASDSGLPLAAINAQGEKTVTILHKYYVEFYRYLNEPALPPVFKCGDTTKYLMKLRVSQEERIYLADDKWTPQMTQRADEEEAYTLYGNASEGWRFKPCISNQGEGEYDLLIEYEDLYTRKTRYLLTNVIMEPDDISMEAKKGWYILCTVSPVNREEYGSSVCSNGSDMTVSGGVNGIAYNISTQAYFNGNSSGVVYSEYCNRNNVTLVRGDEIELSVTSEYTGDTHSWRISAPK